MKRIIPLLLCLLFLSSCVNNTAPKDSSQSAQLTPQPHTTAAADLSGSQDVSGEASVEVTKTKAYIFESDMGNQLYLCCEYNNNSEVDCVIDEIIYHVTIDGESTEIKTEQPSGAYCVVRAQHSRYYNAVWTDTKKTKESELHVDFVEIKVSKTDAYGITIAGKDLFIVRNYPAFCTVSGELFSSDDASMNLVYIGFYDKDENLLGVWCASEPHDFVYGEYSHFTMHMKNLPIEELEEKTDSINVCGFGFNAL